MPVSLDLLQIYLLSCIPSLLTTYCDISKFGKLYIVSLKKINKNQEICAACYRVTPCFFLFLLSLPPLILLSVIDMLSCLSAVLFSQLCAIKRGTYPSS